MDPFTRYLAELETYMHQVVTPPDNAPPLLYGMLHYHLGWMDAHFQPTHVKAGKRIRPMLLLLCNEAQGGDWHSAIPAAAAIELLHNFTLIHDDIEDQDRVRRGRPTLWVLWGEAQAINAGDALFTLAYRALQNLMEFDIPAERVLRALTCYTNGTLKITEGQCWDIAFETEPCIDETTYLNMIAGKTATLLGVACELGAIIAGSPSAQCDALRRFGAALGLAFQMQDDLLGLWGDPRRTGKAVGADLQRHKKTLPILHGIAHDPHLATLLNQSELDDATVNQAIQRLESVGSKAYTQTQTKRYHDEASKALDQSGGSGEAMDALRALAEKLLNRDT